MTSRIAGIAGELPRLIQLGLLVFLIGAGLDLAYHAALAAGIALDGYLGADGYWAHVVTLAGMVATMAGIFMVGLSHGRNGRKRPDAGLQPDQSGH